MSHLKATGTTVANSKVKTSSLHNKMRNSSMQSSAVHRVSPGKSEKRESRESNIYDVRFRRKDLKEFNPRDYRSANLNEEDIIELKEVFDYYDSTGMGVLLPNDLKLLLTEHGFNPAKKTIYEIIAEFDQDETGGISFPEFMKAMGTRPIKNESRRDVEKVFKKYDRANKGYLTVADLREVMRQFKEPLEEEMMEMMVGLSDIDKDGRIKFEDFYQVMTRDFY